MAPSSTVDDNVRRSNRPRTLTKRARGLHDDEDTPSEREDDDIEEIPPPTAPSSQTPSQSLSKKEQERLKFQERWKTDERSDEEVRDLQVAAWSSRYYAHFKMPPSIRRDGDRVFYEFKCLKKPSEVLSRSREDESTGNLSRHVKSCEPADTVPVKSMEQFAMGSKYNPTKHRVKVALWIAARRRPFLIAEDPELLEIFQDLNSACVTPLRMTISRDIQEMYAITRSRLMEEFKNLPGKVHVAADGWSSPNVISFLGVTLHYHKEGKLHSIILDFIKLTSAHTGEYMAEKLAECLHGFGLAGKLLSFVGDNASNNDTMLTELKVLIPGFRGNLTRIRCFAHVLNLVAKAILSPFANPPKKDDDVAALEAAVNDPDPHEYEADSDKEDPEDSLAPEVEAYDIAAIKAVTDEVEMVGRLDPLTASDLKQGKLAVTKVRKLSTKSHWNANVSQELKEACSECEIVPAKKLVRDVSVRWNSTTNTIHRTVELRPAVEIVVAKPVFNKPRGIQLRRWLPSDDEWTMLEELIPLLDSILYATTKISKSKVPLVHQIIPLIDSLTRVFEDVVDDEDQSMIIRHAALRGLTMLNKYYARTDDSLVYRFAMMLHPSFKTQYFLTAKWPAAWITAAKGLLKTEWEKNYRPAADAAAEAAGRVPKPGKKDRFAAARRQFEELVAEPTATGNALENWLNTPTVPGVTDPIAYWHGYLALKHPLAQMALDFLSAPATSTDVERAFSRGGLTVSKLRHSLSDKSLRAATVLGSWHLEGLVPREDIIAQFKEKHRRPKKRARVDDGIPQEPSIELSDDN